MSDQNSLEIRVLQTLLRETLLRADETYAYLLNPNDPGFVETLRPISAATASRIPKPGRKPIVAHANHVLYGIELANRALAGEDGVFETADWNLAWKLETVSDAEWQKLVHRLEQQTHFLIEQVAKPREWSEIMLTGASSIPAHTAYHLGAIRQMLLEMSPL